MIFKTIKPIKHLIGTLCLIIPLMMTASSAYALHPLITEDTGTQGKGKVELEFGFSYQRDNYLWQRMSAEELFNNAQGKGSPKDKLYEFGAALAYGITDSIDIEIGLPFQHVRTIEKGVYLPYDAATGPGSWEPGRSRSSVGGPADMSLDIKWKFLEMGPASFVLKPVMVFPTGNEDDGLGAGLMGFEGYLVSTIDLAPLFIHINLGYIRSNNNQNEREDLWHVSAALELWVVKERLRLVGDAGFERNPDKSSKMQDVYVLGGIIYSPNPNIDLDLGFKSSLSPAGSESPGADYSILGGTTIRF